MRKLQVLIQRKSVESHYWIEISKTEDSALN